MKRTSLFILGLLASVTLVYAITNLTFNIALPEEKYTNLLSVIEKHGHTNLDEYVSFRLNKEIDDERLGKLLTLWQHATFNQQENAFKILSGSTNFVFNP